MTQFLTAGGSNELTCPTAGCPRVVGTSRLECGDTADCRADPSRQVSAMEEQTYECLCPHYITGSGMMPRPGIPKKLTLRKLWEGELHIPHSRSLERARKGCLRTDRDHVAGRESPLPSRTSVAGVGTKDQFSDEKDGLDSPESNPSATIPTCFDRIEVRVGGLDEWERRGVLLGTKGADGGNAGFLGCWTEECLGGKGGKNMLERRWSKRSLGKKKGEIRKS